MGDFRTASIQTNLTKEQLLERLREDLPLLSWRGGESDEQGPYIAGASTDSIKIKLWLGEFPYDVSISFGGAWLDEHRATEKEKFFLRFINVLKGFSVVS